MSTIQEVVEAGKPETVSTAKEAASPVEVSSKVTRSAPISRRGMGGRNIDVSTNYVRLELEDGKVGYLDKFALAV